MNALKLRTAALEIGILPMAETNWKAVVRKVMKDRAHSKFFGSPERELKIKRDFNDIVSIRSAFGTSVSSDREFGGSFENTTSSKGFIPITIGSTSEIKRKRSSATKQFHVHPGQWPFSRRSSYSDRKTMVDTVIKYEQPVQEITASLTNRLTGIGATQTTIFYKKGVLKTRVVDYNPFAKETINLNGDRIYFGNRVSMIGLFNHNQKILQQYLTKKVITFQKKNSKNNETGIIKTRETAMSVSIRMNQEIREFYLDG